MKRADFPSSVESVDNIIARADDGVKISPKGKDALRVYLSGCVSSNFHTPEVSLRIEAIKKILGVSAGAIDRVFAADHMAKELIQCLRAYSGTKNGDNVAKIALGILEEAIRNGATRRELMDGLRRVYDNANDLKGCVVVPDQSYTNLYSTVIPHLKRRVHELPWGEEVVNNQEEESSLKADEASPASDILDAVQKQIE
jgi:hypothetical protein